MGTKDAPVLTDEIRAAFKQEQVEGLQQRIAERRNVEQQIVDRDEQFQQQIREAEAGRENLRDQRNQVKGTIMELQMQLQELTGEGPPPNVKVTEPPNRQARRQAAAAEAKKAGADKREGQNRRRRELAADKKAKANGSEKIVEILPAEEPKSSNSGRAARP